MKKLIILILFLISLNLVYASEINVQETPVQSVVLPGQNVIFDLEITNTQSFQDEIKAVVTDASWKRQEGKELYSLQAGQKIQDRLTLFPLGYLKPGFYSLNVRFVSTKNPEIFTDKQLLVTIVDYDKLLEANLETNPEGIDPRKDNLVKVNLMDNYNINLENVQVHIENNLFVHDITTNLQGLKTKSEEFIITLDPSTKEGDYDTKILVKYNAKTLVDKNIKLKVSLYSNIKETKTQENNFLIKTTTASRVNNGNGISNEVYTLHLSSFKKLFTKFDPLPSNEEETTNGFRYEWRFTLQPGEEYKIMIKTNYRTALILIILIILVIYFGYKLFKIDLSVNKKALILRSQEGGIAGVKVLIYIKNNGPQIRNLHLVDIVPNDLEIPHEYITLKPNSIKKDLTSSTIIWEIPEVSKGEERVISYKLKSKTGHKGRLLMPRAVCRYKNNTGKIFVENSNEIVVNT